MYMDPYYNFYLGLFFFFIRCHFFSFGSYTAKGFEDFLKAVTGWVCSELSFSAFVQFLLFLWASLPAHVEYESLEVWIAGSSSDAQSLVRRAFLLALGMTDLRSWCRLKLKRIAEMRPQKDTQVAKVSRGSLIIADFRLPALQKVFL